MKIKSLVAAGMAIVASLAMASDALAAPQSASGSVWGPVPNVPLQVCAGATCQQTPPLKDFYMQVNAHADGTVAPTVTPASCASGVGGRLVVGAGPAGATFVGSVSATRSDGSPYLLFFGPVQVAPNSTATASACTSASSPTAMSLIQRLLGGLSLG